MAGMNPYAQALSGMAAQAMPKPQNGPNPMTSAFAPPPPTGMGAMSTGGASGGPRESVSAAILALRDVKNHFPSMGQQVDSWISSLQESGKPFAIKPPALSGEAPGGAPSMPPIPGATPPSPLSPPPLPG